MRLALTLVSFSLASSASLSFAQEEEDVEEEYRVGTVLLTPEEAAKMGGAVTRVDEEELQANEYDDANSQVSKIPSVNVRTEDGFGLRPNIGIRGASSDRSKKVTLMEDGVLFGPAPYSAPAAYYFPMVNRTVGLEVFKGPAGIRFGPNTIGGALNWISRPVPYDTVVGADINLGSYVTRKYHSYIGVANDWGGFLFEGIGWGSEGYKELDTGGPTGFEKEEMVLKTRLNSDASKPNYHELELKLGYAREKSNETYLGLTDVDFAENPFRRYAVSELDEMNWWRTQVALTYRFELGRDFDWVTTLYRHDFDRLWRRFNGFPGVDTHAILSDPNNGTNAVLLNIMRGEEDSAGIDPVIVDNDRRFVSQGAQTEAAFRISKDDYYNELRIGARLHFDSVDRVHGQNQREMIDGRLSESSTPLATTTDNKAQTLAFATFLQDTLSIGRFTFVPGARLEVILTDFEDRRAETTSGETRTIVIPGIGGHFALTDALGLLAGVHRGFSPVAPGQPSAVKPETSINYEAGVRYAAPKDGTLLEVVGFFNDYQNLSGQCSFSAGCANEDIDVQFNAGTANVVGFEFVAAHRFKSTLVEGGEVPIRLSYTYTLGEFDSTFSSPSPIYGSVRPGDALPYVPRHQGSLSLGLIGDKIGFSLTSTLVGAMPEQAGEGAKTDPYAMTDLLVKRRVYGPLWVYVKADNLFNVQPIGSRRPFGARPVRPFLAQLGIKATW